MDTNEIRQAIIEVITNCAGNDGWSNLAEIGGNLRKKGIKYGKLSHFFKDYTDIVDIKIDDTKQPPVSYAKLKT